MAIRLDPLTGALKIATQGSGSSVNSFETVQTPSGTSPVADSSTDTLTLTASSPLTITGNSTTDSIAFAVSAAVNAQTGTTYTLQTSDNGKVVTLSNASAITVTTAVGLGAGFSCLLIQLGAGQVTISQGSCVVNNRQSQTKIAGQYGVASLFAYAANTFILGGDTGT